MVLSNNYSPGAPLTLGGFAWPGRRRKVTAPKYVELAMEKEKEFRYPGVKYPWDLPGLGHLKPPDDYGSDSFRKNKFRDAAYANPGLYLRALEEAEKAGSLAGSTPTVIAMAGFRDPKVWAFLHKIQYKDHPLPQPPTMPAPTITAIWPLLYEKAFAAREVRERAQARADREAFRELTEVEVVAVEKEVKEVERAVLEKMEDDVDDTHREAVEAAAAGNARSVRESMASLPDVKFSLPGFPDIGAFLEDVFPWVGLVGGAGVGFVVSAIPAWMIGWASTPISLAILLGGVGSGAWLGYSMLSPKPKKTTKGNSMNYHPTTFGYFLAPPTVAGTLGQLKLPGAVPPPPAVNPQVYASNYSCSVPNIQTFMQPPCNGYPYR